MVVEIYFILFGALSGLAYLAYRHQKDLISFGIGGIAVASLLSGLASLINSNSGVSGGFATFLMLLRNVSFGVGASFLLFVGAKEALKWYQARQERNRERVEAFQLSLRKDAETKSGPRTITKT